MRRILRIIALLVVVGTLGIWVATGAHRGWTKTSVTVVEVEPVTGIENPVQKKQFVMGVELLAAGLGLAAAFAAVSLFFKDKPNKEP